MKIFLLTTSSGETHCSNCFRDNLYAQALRNAGHNVTIMPLYLPIANRSLRADTPLFFPATSYYVAQKFFKKGKMPRFLEKMLDSSALLRLAASFSGTTSAKGMEQMTLSMITGEGKSFEYQVEKIIHWIEQHDRPEVIHLPTSMLTGIAKAIKNRMDIPIVCSLKDEEVWIDDLESRYARQAWEAIGRNSIYIDRFVASSESYKSISLDKIPEIKEIAVVSLDENIAEKLLKIYLQIK